MLKSINKNSEGKLLLAFLKNVPFDGWTWKALYNSADDINIVKGDLTGEDKIQLRDIFENNLVEIVKRFNEYLDLAMRESFKKSKQTNLRIPEKIKSQIMFRLTSANEFKEAIRISIGMMSLPKNSKIALSMLFKTCDIIWRDCDDKSTDFSFYTKRLILSGVYSSTLTYWLNENDNSKVEEFLERRLNDVSKLGKLKKCPNLMNRSPFPFENIFKLLKRFNVNKFSYKPND